MALPFPFPDALTSRGVRLRREQAGDRDFAAALYAANRMPELALAPWPMAAKQDFLADQFAAQSRHIAKAWPRADRFAILQDDAAIGRLYLGRSRACWHVIEIAVLPQVQNQGIGAALLQALQAGTVAAGVPLLDLEVALDNPRATALYARLGFAEVPSASPTHRTMAWRGPAAAPHYPATHVPAPPRGRQAPEVSARENRHA